MKNIIEAIRYAFAAAVDKWHYVRHLQRGGNPDELPF